MISKRVGVWVGRARAGIFVSDCAKRAIRRNQRVIAEGFRFQSETSCAIGRAFGLGSGVRVLFSGGGLGEEGMARRNPRLFLDPRL